MMGWCPNDGQECHHDGYCKDCPHEEGTVNGMDDETQSRIERVLSGKSPEEQYDILYWLMMEYGKGHSNSRLARIEWLKGKGGDNHEG